MAKGSPRDGSASSSQLWLQALVLFLCVRPGYNFVIRSSSTTTNVVGRTFEKSSALLSASEYHSDEEWHPRDPAYTTPQLLAGLWHQIAQAGSMSKGETYTVIYPEMEDQFNQQPPRYLNNVLAHLDYCKDVCDHFGMTTSITPFLDQRTKKIVGFTAKSFRNPKRPSKGGGVANQEEEDDDGEDEYNFAYDPYWDDGTDFDSLYKGVDDDDMPTDPYPEIVNKVPIDDDEIIDVTKEWVQTMMSNMGICPFSPNADTAGLPVGPVYYSVDRTSTVEDMYVKYWEQVVRVEQQNEKELSTTLFIIPEFFMDNVELFESFSNTLTQPLTALQVEDLVQLVFFHPQWSFRDGGDRATKAQAANYARRSPWPMINILRTKQVRAAQRGIPTGLVYKQNEKTLNQIGADELETMLRLRDWSALSDKKVNRREMDALKIAQDFQQSGKVKKDDTNLANDATPVANRVVDVKQVEQGNLVNVLSQALEKRIGAAPLSGPETSATSMATEYLLKELEQIASSLAEKSSPALEKTPVPQTTPAPYGATASSSKAPAELEAARKAQLEKARRMLMDDLDGDESYGASERGNEMSDILFGRGGVQARSKDDDDFDAFRSFQG